MYDEIALSNLQHALVPPIPIMSAEELCQSSIVGSGTWKVVVRSIKRDLERWRAELAGQVELVAGQDPLFWDNPEVLEIEHSISLCDQLSQEISRKSRQSYNRAMKANRRLIASNDKLAETQKRNADLIRGWQTEIVDALNEIGSTLTLYRSRLSLNVGPAATLEKILLPLQRHNAVGLHRREHKSGRLDEAGFPARQPDRSSARSGRF